MHPVDSLGENVRESRFTGKRSHLWVADGRVLSFRQLRQSRGVSVAFLHYGEVDCGGDYPDDFDGNSVVLRLQTGSKRIGGGPGRLK